MIFEVIEVSCVFSERLHSAVHQEELLYEPRVVIERCDQIDHLRAMHYGHGLKKQQV
jgi:hypothetical protein